MCAGSELSGGADLETHEALDGHACLVEDRLDGLLGVRDRRLLGQNDVLEVTVDAAFDDLRQCLLGLAFCAGGLFGDVTLGSDDLLGNLVTRDVLRLSAATCIAAPRAASAAASPSPVYSTRTPTAGGKSELRLCR